MVYGREDDAGNYNCLFFVPYLADEALFLRAAHARDPVVGLG